jgi:hypothetical protein
MSVVMLCLLATAAAAVHVICVAAPLVPAWSATGSVVAPYDTTLRSDTLRGERSDASVAAPSPIFLPDAQLSCCCITRDAVQVCVCNNAPCDVQNADVVADSDHGGARALRGAHDAALRDSVETQRLMDVCEGAIEGLERPSRVKRLCRAWERTRR